MVDVVNTEYGTDNPSLQRVTDDNSYMEQFSEFNYRIPTNAMARLYIPFFILNATQAVGTYVIGVCPFKSTLLAVSHVCKTVTAAATLEIESGSSGACMTADSIAVAVQNATITSTAADALFDKGDIISAKIGTGGGDIVHLAGIIVLQPIW